MVALLFELFSNKISSFLRGHACPASRHELTEIRLPGLSWSKTGYFALRFLVLEGGRWFTARRSGQPRGFPFVAAAGVPSSGGMPA